MFCFCFCFWYDDLSEQKTIRNKVGWLKMNIGKRAFEMQVLRFA